MDDLSKNLRQLLTFFNLSENELGRRCGVPQQVINRILTGKNQNPKLATLSFIAKYFSITVSQLLGEDKLPLDPRIKKNVTEGFEKIPLLKWSQISNLIKEIKNKKNIKVMTDAIVSEKTFALTNQDDSMEPKFPQQTILIFDCLPTPKHGDYALIYNEKNHTALFRQLWLKNGAAYLKSLNLKNEDYKLRKLNDEEKILATLIQSKIDFC